MVERTLQLFDTPLTSLSDCATGHHAWRKTLLIGKSVCETCGAISYCLYCTPGDIPPGSPLRPCWVHRYRPAPLADSTRPLSALTR